MCICLVSLVNRLQKRERRKIKTVMCFSFFAHQDDSFKSKIAMFNNSGANVAKEPQADPFQTEDPFKSFSGQNNSHSFFSVEIKVLIGLTISHIILYSDCDLCSDLETISCLNEADSGAFSVRISSAGKQVLLLSTSTNDDVTTHRMMHICD